MKNLIKEYILWQLIDFIPFSQTDALGQSPELKCLEQNEKRVTLAKEVTWFRLFGQQTFVNAYDVADPVVGT